MSTEAYLEHPMPLRSEMAPFETFEFFRPRRASSGPLQRTIAGERLFLEHNIIDLNM